MLDFIAHRLALSNHTRGFSGGGKEYPSRSQTWRRVTVIMNIIHERRTARGTTTARPFESNAIELEKRGAGFLVRLITKVCETITSRMPVGYEDEAGFHFGVAEARLIPIRTARHTKHV
jgi:hypothetical protein